MSYEFNQSECPICPSCDEGKVVEGKCIGHPDHAEFKPCGWAGRVRSDEELDHDEALERQDAYRMTYWLSQ